MENKISFFGSAYILMSMFLSIYIFASNIMALGMALVFGSVLIIGPFYVFQDSVHQFKKSFRSFLLKIKNANS